MKVVEHLCHRPVYDARTNVFMPPGRPHLPFCCVTKPSSQLAVSPSGLSYGFTFVPAFAALTMKILTLSSSSDVWSCLMFMPQTYGILEGQKHSRWRRFNYKWETSCANDKTRFIKHELKKVSSLKEPPYCHWRTHNFVLHHQISSYNV
jgi:hypothetical protein